MERNAFVGSLQKVYSIFPGNNFVRRLSRYAGRKHLLYRLQSSFIICQCFVIVASFSLAMRYVAAYLLATLGGKGNPSKEDIQKILESVGLDVDDEKLSKVRPC